MIESALESVSVSALRIFQFFVFRERKNRGEATGGRLLLIGTPNRFF